MPINIGVYNGIDDVGDISISVPYEFNLCFAKS